jgi:RimJ/RimL family protein N-acetyltransferase
MRAEDYDALLTIFTDPKVMAAFDSTPFTHGQMQQWLDRNLDHQKRYGFGLFSVLRIENGVLIGNCGLEVMRVGGEDVAELGYDFRSDYWNQGYATEAAITVRNYARHQLLLPQLISLIRVGNNRSQRVAEKIGMSHTASFTRGAIEYWQYALQFSRGQVASL